MRKVLTHLSLIIDGVVVVVDSSITISISVAVSPFVPHAIIGVVDSVAVFFSVIKLSFVIPIGFSQLP
jgi:hypothetical protein